MKRCGKSAPASRATGVARQTPPGARSYRERASRPQTLPGRPHRWMVIHGDTGFHPVSPGQNPAYRSTPRHHPSRISGTTGASWTVDNSPKRQATHQSNYSMAVEPSPVSDSATRSPPITTGGGGAGAAARSTWSPTRLVGGGGGGGSDSSGSDTNSRLGRQRYQRHVAAEKSRQEKPESPDSCLEELLV